MHHLVYTFSFLQSLQVLWIQLATTPSVVQALLLNFLVIKVPK